MHWNNMFYFSLLTGSEALHCAILIVKELTGEQQAPFLPHCLQVLHWSRHRQQNCIQISPLFQEQNWLFYVGIILLVICPSCSDIFGKCYGCSCDHEFVTLVSLYLSRSLCQLTSCRCKKRAECSLLCLLLVQEPYLINLNFNKILFTTSYEYSLSQF